MLLLAGASLLTSSVSAQAHAVLLFAFALVFDEPVQPAGARTARITTAAGKTVDVGSAARSEGGRQVTVPLHGTLKPGVYTVDWQVAAQDGDVMGGSYRFAVGSAAAGLSAGLAGGQQQVSGAGTTAVLRWVLFGVFALALGGLVGERLAARHGITTPRPWARAGAVGGLVASLGLAVLIAGGGNLAEGFSSSSGPALFGGRAGVLAVIEAAALLVAAVALARGWRPAAWAGLAGAAVSEGLSGHAGSGQPTMSVRQRTAAVVLGLLVALATVLGAACLCAHRHTVQPVTVFSAYDTSDGGAREHACALPAHDQCGAKAAGDMPTTGPGPHSQPLTLPAWADTRPASSRTVINQDSAAPRAPDLHALQVLRT
ncbi:copper resistance protein CopC [Streptomyces longwoodensis]|uniref:copper resistance CopC family protein n=1 Tax=Streptomyces longwoodensis TaxID=68231 RepID=UPI0036F03123